MTTRGWSAQGARCGERVGGRLSWGEVADRDCGGLSEEGGGEDVWRQLQGGGRGLGGRRELEVRPSLGAVRARQSRSETCKRLGCWGGRRVGMGSRGE